LRPVETVPGMEEGGIKENDGGSEFKYDTADMLVLCSDLVYKIVIYVEGYSQVVESDDK
jgi:hypothetical protein